MTIRRPLVRVNGKTRQMPSGDTLPSDCLPSGGGGGGVGYGPAAFTNASLTAGVLTVTHGLGQKNIPAPTVFNNLSQIVYPDFTAVDNNTCTISFANFGTLSGTWYVYVPPVGVASSVIDNDPALGGASPSSLKGATQDALQKYIRNEIQKALAAAHF